MKKYLFVCTYIFSTLFLFAIPELPTGKRLRDIIKENYPKGNIYIGTACKYSLLNSDTAIILDREFSYVTPTNDFKQTAIHPTPNKWSWKKSDAWVKHCAKHHQVMRLHAPISPQCSKWVKDDKRTATELQKMLEEYLTALYKRYDHFEHVKWIDVVNETVTRKGDWHGPRIGTAKWENPWPKIGYDQSVSLKPPVYIKMAFKIANKYAPNTKLIINQHGGMEDKMWKKVKALVPYLRKQGLRVDGIGWQAHINAGWEKEEGNLDKLRALIDWAHANKLEFHVTENNVWQRKNKKLQAQADTFNAIIKVLLEKKDSGVVTWNLWNIRDCECQRKTLKGCLFFDNYKAKPAYYAIQKILLEKNKTITK